MKITDQSFDYTIIGGGIVGISTALQLKQQRPQSSVIVLEKDASVATQQTGHNSGVIHAGVYYAPGSLKADFCKRGAAATMRFCDANAIEYRQCGKLLVACNDFEMQGMHALQQRCLENGIECKPLDQQALNRKEPSIQGLAALEIPQSAIVDFVKITERMAELFEEEGGVIAYNNRVIAATEHPDHIEIRSSAQTIRTEYLISCSGLSADRMCRMLNITTDFAIVPFRGEYFRLSTDKNTVVKHLIYPIPDPAMPFLGVHLTPMIDGCITVGPNAVLGWKREGYGQFNFSARDTLETLCFPGFWKMAKTNFRFAIGEMANSFYKPGYLKRVQKYCPELTLDDLRPYPAGVRAQAIMRDGTLVQDFLFAESTRSLHVCNAPSPAATSALPIGEHIVAEILKKSSGSSNDL